MALSQALQGHFTVSQKDAQNSTVLRCWQKVVNACVLYPWLMMADGSRLVES